MGENMATAMITCKLNFGNGGKSDARQSDAKSHNALLAQRRVEDALGPVLVPQPHRGPEDASKGHLPFP